MFLPFKKIHKGSSFQKFLEWSLREEFLDTDQLLKLHYGNLVFRRQSPLYLTKGVTVAFLLLALFWLVTANWDIIASGREYSGKTAIGESYASVTSLIQLAPPPPSAAEPVAVHSVVHPAQTSAVGKIVKVSQQEGASENTAATQQEIRQSAQGAGSGNGGESSGIAGLGDEGTIFGSLEKMPGFLEQKKPDYPEAARVAGISGKIFVKVLIGEDGRPLKATVMKRIPAECTVFDGVALKSVFESKYYPGILNGRAVKVWCVVPVNFRLR